MPSPISKHALEHLARLARIELDHRREEKLLHDLGKILDHFEELKELDTSNVEPLAGGSMLKNVFRDDAASENTDQGAGVGAFPEKENGALKIPPVFSAEGGSPSGEE